MEDEMKKFDMTLSAEEIDAALMVAANAVTYVQQTLTPEQQAQARANIGAASVEDVLAALPIGEGVRY